MEQNRTYFFRNNSTCSYNRLLCFLIIFFLIQNPLLSQNQLPVKVHGVENIRRNFPKTIDSVPQLESILKKLADHNLQKGYLSFSIDSVFADSSEVIVKIFQGQPYYLGRIYQSNSLIFQNSQKKAKFKATLNSLENWDKKILSNYIDHGYPFTKINKKTKFREQFIDVYYQAEPGKKYVFDSISIIGKQVVSPNYLRQITGIKPEMPYSQIKIDHLSRALNQSVFLKTDSIALKYDTNKVKVQLKLENIQQNTFSGILGIHTNKEQKTEITGQASMYLVNTFKKGESIQLNWQKFSSESQDLETQFKLPYVFHLPVGIYGKILFYKQDTTYTNTDLQGGIILPLFKNTVLGVHMHKSSSTTSKSTDGNYSSNEKSLYGLIVELNQLNNTIFPTKGIHAFWSAETGNKTDLNTSNNKYKSLFSEFSQKVSVYTRVPFGSLLLQNHSAFLLNDSLYTNNLFRLGGFSTIRGFNEKSIYALSYSYFTLEYRIQLGTNSYAYVFSDAGWFREPSENSFKTYARESAGMGLFLHTKGGIVSIAYAIGNSYNNTFNPSKAQIHIGYQNRF